MADGASVDLSAMEGGVPASATQSESVRRATANRPRGVGSPREALTARNALNALLRCHWRRVVALLIYVVSMSSIFSVRQNLQDYTQDQWRCYSSSMMPLDLKAGPFKTLTSYGVAAGGFEWALVGWGVIVAIVIFSSVSLARALHRNARSAGVGRRRQFMSRRALEATLQLRHPSIELRRLRLLLVDRDFTGEDYQALLDLDDTNEVPSTVGASEGEIRRNPSFLVREPDPDSVTKPRSCTICLYPFQPRERVRIIPCLHQFHTECIDPWLRQNAICPVCKFPVVG